MKIHNIILVTLLFGLFPLSILGQQQHRFGFHWDRTIEVRDSLGNQLDYPWAGGINAMHFSQIDLNLDGVQDLIGFDVHGQQLLPFINKGITNTVAYTYAPEYLGRFPEMGKWMRTYDYNQDGKLDLFIHYKDDIRAYKNISSAANGLRFELVKESIEADYGNNFTYKIYASVVDYPAFADVDFDGDMDIVCFYLWGTFVNYYRNMSMETYGHADSLIYKLDSECWGEFAEEDDNNRVILDTNNYSKQGPILPPKSSSSVKHAGSTLTLYDINNDSLMDLLLGDVDFFGINLLTNGGTRDTTRFISQDTEFPNYSDPINLISFPNTDIFDVDNDGVNEMVVGSYEAAYYKTSAVQSVHLYDNVGSNAVPHFQKQSTSFIQDQMIDAGDNAVPAIADINGDGLLDIVIGIYGNIRSANTDTITYILTVEKYAQLQYLENIGSTNQPAFQIKHHNWASTDSLDLIASRPTFGDIDSDGDEDMILGNSEGDLLFFENIAGSGHVMEFAAPIRSYQGIDVGAFSSPQLYDLDGDQKLDLIIGNKVGTLSYYHNTGSAQNPVFTLESNHLGDVDVRTFYYSNSAYSVPYLYKDEQNQTKLFVGSASGLTFFYDKIDQNISGSFGQDSSIYKLEYTTLGDSINTLYSFLQFENSGSLQEISNEGLRSAPALADFNNDGFADMILGNFRGGLRYFSGKQAPFVGIPDVPHKTIEFNLAPNPSTGSTKISWNKSYNESEIIIYDARGIMVERFLSNNNQIIVNTTQMHPGLYLVVLKQGKEFAIQKLMVQR